MFFVLIAAVGEEGGGGDVASRVGDCTQTPKTCCTLFPTHRVVCGLMCTTIRPQRALKTASTTEYITPKEGMLNHSLYNST